MALLGLTRARSSQLSAVHLCQQSANLGGADLRLHLIGAGDTSEWIVTRPLPLLCMYRGAEPPTRRRLAPFQGSGADSAALLWPSMCLIDRHQCRCAASIAITTMHRTMAIGRMLLQVLWRVIQWIAVNVVDAFIRAMDWIVWVSGIPDVPRAQEGGVGVAPLGALFGSQPDVRAALRDPDSLEIRMIGALSASIRQGGADLCAYFGALRWVSFAQFRLSETFAARLRQYYRSMCLGAFA